MAIATRITSLIVVLLLTSSVAQAQHRWSGPAHWYKDWLWWVGEATIAAIEATDAHSTILARDGCPGCVETNRFIGPHPSNRGVIVSASVGFGIESLLHFASWQTCPDPNHEFRSWRIACDMLIPGTGAAIVGHSIAHNYHLASQFKPAAPPSSSMAIQRFQFGEIQSARTGSPNWVPSRGNELPLFVPKQFSGCGRSVTLCTPSQRTAEPKIDLRLVHFR